jgi:hypothetical protein
MLDARGHCLELITLEVSVSYSQRILILEAFLNPHPCKVIHSTIEMGPHFLAPFITCHVRKFNFYSNWDFMNDW